MPRYRVKERRSLGICSCCENFQYIIQMMCYCRCARENDQCWLEVEDYVNSQAPEGCPFAVEHEIFDLNEESGK